MIMLAGRASSPRREGRPRLAEHLARGGSTQSRSAHCVRARLRRQRSPPISTSVDAGSSAEAALVADSGGEPPLVDARSAWNASAPMRAPPSSRRRGDHELLQVEPVALRAAVDHVHQGAGRRASRLATERSAVQRLAIVVPLRLQTAREQPRTAFRTEPVVGVPSSSIRIPSSSRWSAVETVTRSRSRRSRWRPRRHLAEIKGRVPSRAPLPRARRWTRLRRDPPPDRRSETRRTSTRASGLPQRSRIVAQACDVVIAIAASSPAARFVRHLLEFESLPVDAGACEIRRQNSTRS